MEVDVVLGVLFSSELPLGPVFPGGPGWHVESGGVRLQLRTEITCLSLSPPHNPPIPSISPRQPTELSKTHEYLPPHLHHLHLLYQAYIYRNTFLLSNRMSLKILMTRRNIGAGGAESADSGEREASVET